MVENESSPNKYNILKISIATVTKNAEMLKFAPEHLKTKKICKNAVLKMEHNNVCS